MTTTMAAALLALTFCGDSSGPGAPAPPAPSAGPEAPRSPDSPSTPDAPGGPQPAAALRAFPGAEGGGALARGGRGGTVHRVTNLNDAGDGSLRACVEASGPRTCVFAVGGHVVLARPLLISNPYLTIAGQTAPGGGIQLSRKGDTGAAPALDSVVEIETHDVVLRYLRLRQGLNPSGGAALAWNHGVRVVMLDHLSIAWGVWGNLSLWSMDSGFRDVTIGWSIIAEPLSAVNSAVNVNISGRSPEIANASTDVDLHHNFFSGASHRSPLHSVKSGRIVNNVVFNWAFFAIRTKGYKDIVGNYIRPGPYTRWRARTREIHAWTTNEENCTTEDPSLYVEGNAGENDGYRVEGDDWTTLTALVANQSAGETGGTVPIPSRYRRTTPLCSSAAVPDCTPVGAAVPAITVDPADGLANPGGAFLRTVGASRRLDCEGNWVDARDAADARLVKEFTLGGGRTRPPRSEAEVGGFPRLEPGTACPDGDADGMPDAFEKRQGLDPTDPSDGSATAPDGYTWLEHYLDGN